MREQLTEKAQVPTCRIESVGAFGDRRCATHNETWNRLHDGPWCPSDERLNVSTPPEQTTGGAPDA